MFSSCCRCVNRKALKEQLSENDNEFEEDEEEAQKSSRAQAAAGDNAASDDDGYSSRNELDTTLRVIIEENDNNREEEEGEGAGQHNDDAAATSNDVVTKTNSAAGAGAGVVGETSGQNQQSENESVSAIVNNACNISDEEKQKMLDKQHSGSTDNEDDGMVPSLFNSSFFNFSLPLFLLDIISLHHICFATDTRSDSYFILLLFSFFTFKKYLLPHFFFIITTPCVQS